MFMIHAWVTVICNYYYYRGILKIAEVASRFENVRNFITALANLGFKMVSKVRQQTTSHQTFLPDALCLKYCHSRIRMK